MLICSAVVLGIRIHDVSLSPMTHCSQHVISSSHMLTLWCHILQGAVQFSIAWYNELLQGSVSAGKRSKSTNWKALLLQKKATKRTGAVAIEGMPQPGHTSQKRRQLPPTAEAAADFPGACVDPQDKHVIEASKPVREADALNQNSGKKQGPDLMTLLTCGSLPE